jgi:uncharacterized repeat protein (TIGR02543 family)/LPXTG-motif cell wall-anchored protein
MLLAAVPIASAAPGDGGTFTAPQEMGASQTVLGAELTSAGTEVKMDVKYQPPSGYGLKGLALVAFYDYSQLEYVRSEGGNAMSAPAEYTMPWDASGNTHSLWVTWAAGGSLVNPATITLVFKIKQAFIDNGSLTYVRLGPVNTVVTPTGIVLQGSGTTNDLILATSVTDGTGPYGMNAETPYADIAGINPSLGVGAFPIKGALVNVTYDPGTAGGSATGMPSPLTRTTIYDSATATTVASAPAWDASHTFAGWKLTTGTVTGATTGTTVYAAGSSLSHIVTDVTLTAQWNTVTPTWNLTYDANIPSGASGTLVTTPTVQAGLTGASAALGSPSGVPTKSGGTYSFAGWADSASAVTPDYTSASTIPVQASNKTVYAVWSWTAATYTVTYHANYPSDATAGDGVVPSTDTVTHGANYTVVSSPVPSAPTKTGGHYGFVGWGLSAGATTAQAALSNVTANTDLYAIWAWTENGKWNLAYNANIPNGASGSAVTLPSAVTGLDLSATTQAGTPTGLPTRLGYTYTFVEWTDVANGGTYDPGDTVSPLSSWVAGNTGGTITLYARWSENAVGTWEVRYDVNASSVPTASVSGVVLPADQEITADGTSDSAALGTPTGLPTETGYSFTFAGWNTAANGTGTAYSATDTIPSSVASTVHTLYAQWTRTPLPQYTLSYDANIPSVADGSSVSVPASVTDYAGSSIALTAPTGVPARSGGSYVFAGWATAAGAATATYPAASLGSIVLTGDTTLYAVWIWTADLPLPAATWTVTYNLNYAGLIYRTDTNIANGATITAPADPTRASYTFGGWFKDAACTQAWDYANDTVTADITLYAKWTPVTEQLPKPKPTVVDLPTGEELQWLLPTLGVLLAAAAVIVVTRRKKGSEV